MDDTAPAGAPAPVTFPAADSPLAPVPAIGDEPAVPLPPPVEREAERLTELLARLQSAGPATDAH